MKERNMYMEKNLSLPLLILSDRFIYPIRGERSANIPDTRHRFISSRPVLEQEIRFKLLRSTKRGRRGRSIFQPFKKSSASLKSSMIEVREYSELSPILFIDIIIRTIEFGSLLIQEPSKSSFQYRKTIVTHMVNNEYIFDR